MAFGLTLLAWGLCIATVLCAEDDHDHDHHHHDHGEDSPEGFEWAGVFSTPEESYMWTAQKAGGKYAYPKMKIAVFPVSHIDEYELKGLQEKGRQALNRSVCDEVQVAGVLTPAIGKCYQLVFKQDWWQSLYTIDAGGVRGVAIFAEHVPTEFESTAHYLKSDHGEDLEPAAQIPAAPAGSGSDTKTAVEIEKPWGAALAATFLVNLITCSGVILLMPGLKTLVKKYSDQFDGLMSGFTAGALIGCAFFLLLFEATHFVAAGWSSEVDTVWRWGTMVIVGFLFPSFIDNTYSVVRAFVMNTPSVTPKQTEEAADDSGVASAQPSKDTSRARIIGSIIIGDFFHNFCDGIFIAAAFSGCGTAFGWGVALGSALHEFPQELCDFSILTGKSVSLSAAKALVFNFVSGLGVMLGALLALSLEMDSAAIGLLLAFGGGVYLHIAATECMPRTYNPNLSVRVRFGCLITFIFGAILIGLVLLGHEHCSPADGQVDLHAGHNH